MKVKIRILKPTPGAIAQGLCFKGQIREEFPDDAAAKVRNGVAEYVTEPETTMIEAPPNRMMPRGRGRRIAAN